MTLLPERNGVPLGGLRVRCRRAAARAGWQSRLGWLPAALVACTPALDWRDVRPAGTDLQLLMPCKPDRQERRLQLAGQPARLVLHVCSAGGQTWGLAFADVGDPARLGDVMQQLVRAAGSNIDAVASPSTPLLLPGATPHRLSQTVVYRGSLPEGKPVQMQVAVFARGTQAFQATVLGGDLPAEAIRTFMESFRFAR